MLSRTDGPVEGVGRERAGEGAGERKSRRKQSMLLSVYGTS